MTTTTQAQRLIAAIRKAGRKGLTYLELELLRVSSCPWGRLRSGERPERFLRPGEKLAKKTGADGLVRFVITRSAA